MGRLIKQQKKVERLDKKLNKVVTRLNEVLAACAVEGLSVKLELGTSQFKVGPNGLTTRHWIMRS